MDALISSVDIAPTIVSMAGLKSPESMQGKDFSTVLNQKQDMSKWRDAVFMEDLFLVDSSVMLRFGVKYELSFGNT